MYVRLGGTAQDNITYDMGRTAHTARGRTGASKSIPAGTLTAAAWDEMCDFAGRAGWDILFGLNNLYGWDASAAHTWDSSNAKALMAYTQKRGCNVVGWEIGNESNLKNKVGWQPA